MSTRCQVVKKLKDDLYEGIYVHFDGYVRGGVGETLYKYYSNERLVDKLLALGDLSSLGKYPESDVDYWKRTSNPSSISDFTTRNGYCVAFKDRDFNLDRRARTGPLDDFFSDEYCYVWKDNEWYICDYEHKEGTKLSVYFKY